MIIINIFNKKHLLYVNFIMSDVSDMDPENSSPDEDSVSSNDGNIPGEDPLDNIEEPYGI